MTAGERQARETGERPAGETPADFELIPAVDVLGDEAVRLEQGDFARVTLRAGDPAELVRRFAERRAPRIHVVDLAGAPSRRVRPPLVAALVAEAAPVPLQAAGGVRSPADALALVAAGGRRGGVRLGPLPGAGRRPH